MNELLIAAVLIVSFSLLSYITLQNRRSDTARALGVMLASVVIVNGGDVLLHRDVSPATTQLLLRAQWLGIALVPAAYLHLANALMASIQGADRAHSSRWLVWAGYIGSGLFFFLALSTDMVVLGDTPQGPIAQFGAGPLFWFYTLFFVGSGLFVLRAIVKARNNALTSTLRRRLTYLGATFVAPGLGVFPYLVVAGGYAFPSTDIVLLLSSVVNATVIAMITVMTYSSAFQGVLLPDRLIKQDFVRWWLYGPVVGITVMLCLQILPWLERRLGWPSNTLLTFGVMVMTVLMPLLVKRIRPYLDTLIYMQDRAEIDYLHNLPRVTFTRTDLRQLLENSLIAICGALRIETGFVFGPSNGEYTVKASCGPRREIKRFVAAYPLSELAPQLESLPAHDPGTLPPTDMFLYCEGFCLLPLRSPDGKFIGALGLAYAPESLRRDGPLSNDSRRLIGVLAHQMELALTTVQMQQSIFDTLRNLGPEMETLQHLSSRLDQATPDSLSALETEISLQPEFTQMVKDALNHYWGGPKLSDSPLLGLRTVRRVIQDQGGSPTRALQAVLRQAIANMRPDEQLDPSAQEWLLYNILEGRFLQGKPVRDLASRLAMSESDFYRKQRIAVEEVARQLTMMEESER